MTNTHDAKVMADGAAVVVGLGGFMEWFPPIVALVGGLLTIVWLTIRIWETDTVQKLVYKDAVNKQETT
jgi:Flp pilus assembly protein protease CpaA